MCVKYSSVHSDGLTFNASKGVGEKLNFILRYVSWGESKLSCRMLRLLADGTKID